MDKRTPQLNTMHFLRKRVSQYVDMLSAGGCLSSCKITAKNYGAQYNRAIPFFYDKSKILVYVLSRYSRSIIWLFDGTSKHTKMMRLTSIGLALFFSSLIDKRSGEKKWKLKR